MTTLLRTAILSLAALATSSTLAIAADVDAVVAHPLFGKPYACVEHWQGQFPSLGDALGTDCFVQEFVDDEDRIWSRAYKSDGRANTDWFGWHQDVLSPCECTVTRTNDNPVVNEPGRLGKPPASFVILKRDDGVMFMLAHVTDLRVATGDRVAAGQAIARVGNNGYARAPHIHIGAWKDRTPLQIRFDQQAMGRLFKDVQ